jgi:lipoprotein signal peptidase
MVQLITFHKLNKKNSEKIMDQFISQTNILNDGLAYSSC